MRFKSKASDRAIYKILKLISNIFTITATFTLIYGIILLFSAFTIDSNDMSFKGQLIGAAVGVLITAAVQVYIQLTILSIRDDMVEKSDSEVE